MIIKFSNRKHKRLIEFWSLMFCVCKRKETELVREGGKRRSESV